MTSCMFCSQDTAGNHQTHCPNYSSGRNSDFVRFLDGLSSNSDIELRPFDSLIEKYMGLMSAYMMTVDLLEVAGETFGESRLELVANYILSKLDGCIGAIVALQELEDDGSDDDDDDEE